MKPMNADDVKYLREKGAQLSRDPKVWIGALLGLTFLRSRHNAQLKLQCQAFEKLLVDGRPTEAWKDFKALKAARRQSLLRCSNGKLLLHLASFKGYLEVVQLFLENGANVEAAGKEGRLALHWAAFGARTNTCRALLQGGTPVDACDTYESQALHLAATSPSMSTEHAASLVVKELLSYNAEIEAEDRMGRTPLCCATLAGNVHSMNALEREGANVHHVDNVGWSLAHLAVSRGHIEALKLALQWGVDQGLKDKSGKTASDLAFASGSKITDGQLLHDFQEIDVILRKAAASGNTSIDNSVSHVPKAMQSGTNSRIDRAGHGLPSNHVAVM